MFAKRLKTVLSEFVLCPGSEKHVYGSLQRGDIHEPQTNPFAFGFQNDSFANAPEAV